MKDRILFEWYTLNHRPLSCLCPKLAVCKNICLHISQSAPSFSLLPYGRLPSRLSQNFASVSHMGFLCSVYFLCLSSSIHSSLSHIKNVSYHPIAYKITANSSSFKDVPNPSYLLSPVPPFGPVPTSIKI